MDQLLFRRLIAGFAPREVARAVFRALERSRQRRSLLELSDARLRDIGLTRADVAEEAAKPFWR